MEHTVLETPERRAFYEKIDGENLSALWNTMAAPITPEPRSGCHPFLWRFDSIRARMTRRFQVKTRDTHHCSAHAREPAFI